MWLYCGSVVNTFDVIIQYIFNMKRSLIISVFILVLASTSFTIVQTNRQPTNKTELCCKKAGVDKLPKKAATPMPYLPSVNFF